MWAFFLPAVVFGQVRDTASLFGTVTDAQAAVVPGASVTIVNTATGLTRTAIADTSGGYVFTLLPVGSYNLTVEQPGFRKYERPNILLQANENIRVDVKLDIGNVQETVTVEAGRSQVDTRSATLNHTVDSKRIVELPLNGRNPADLVFWLPGWHPERPTTAATWAAAPGVRRARRKLPSTDRATTISASRWTAGPTWTTW